MMPGNYITESSASGRLSRIYDGLKIAAADRFINYQEVLALIELCQDAHISGDLLLDLISRKVARGACQVDPAVRRWMRNVKPESSAAKHQLLELTL